MHSMLTNASDIQSSAIVVDDVVVPINVLLIVGVVDLLIISIVEERL